MYNNAELIIAILTLDSKTVRLLKTFLNSKLLFWHPSESFVPVSISLNIFVCLFIY